MPQGKGTYGSKRGRPPAAKTQPAKGSKEMKEKMAKLRAMRGKGKK